MEIFSYQIRGNNFNQGQDLSTPVHQPVVNQPVDHHGPAPQTPRLCSKKQILKDMSQPMMPSVENMQNQGQKRASQMANLTDLLSKFVNANKLLPPWSSSNKLPKKLGDPGAFLIPMPDFTGITTCQTHLEHDLGASINLIALFLIMDKDLALPELTPIA
ncbi:hypothetical protein Tco_0658952 [Tanacetum coccineum]